MHARTALVALALSWPAVLSAQNTYHVAPGGNDAWIGASPSCHGPAGPKRTIQAAIDAAGDGDTVLVQDGVYSGAGNRDLDFGGRAISLRSVGGAAACVVDCQGSQVEPHRALRFQSGETAAVLVEGLTIRGGLADFGGAVLCENGSSPTIRACVLVANVAYPGTTGGEGGAVRCTASSPRFDGCRFTQNEAVRVGSVGGRGGAIQFVGGSPVLSDCTFEENTAGAGGGVHATQPTIVTMIGCKFLRNWTADPTFNGGGGYLASLGAHTVLVGCSFIENRTARIAGAAWFTQSATATISGCTFLRNYGFDAGCVGVANGSSAVIDNCLFAENRADIFSAALEVWNGVPTAPAANVVMTNCTLTENVTSAGYGAIVVSLTSRLVGSNDIVWGNAPSDVVVLDSGVVLLDHSDVGGGWPGLGNIDADPRFAHAGSHPFALRDGSPCVDAGDPTFALSPGRHDLRGAFRLWDGNGDAVVRVDMGAYEFGSPLGDLDRNCVIDGRDLSVLARHLPRSSGATPAQGDLDGDGDVDVEDLQLLRAAMGGRCPGCQ